MVKSEMSNEYRKMNINTIILVCSRCEMTMHIYIINNIFWFSTIASLIVHFYKYFYLYCILRKYIRLKISKESKRKLIENKENIKIESIRSIKLNLCLKEHATSQ